MLDISKVPSYDHLLEITDTIPTKDQLQHCLKEEYQAHIYVQLAVCHDAFAHAVIYIAQYWLSISKPTEQALALHYIRALGASYQAKHMLQAFHAQNITLLQKINPLWDKQNQLDHSRETLPLRTNSHFPPAVYYYCRPTLADTYLATLCDLLPENHPMRLQAIDWCLLNQISLSFILQVWPKTRSHIPLLKWSHLLLLEQDEKAIKELVIRLVLMHTDEVLAFCMHVSQVKLPKSVQTLWMQSLHKQCKRIGKIRLWREIRSVMYT